MGEGNKKRKWYNKNVMQSPIPFGASGQETRNAWCQIGHYQVSAMY